MKLKVPQTISNVESFEDLKRFSDQYLTSIRDVVNGNLELGDNVSVSFVQFTFPSANTTYQISHTLGRTPSGYVGVKQTAACDLYDGSGTNTSTSIYLKATVATTVTVMVF